MQLPAQQRRKLERDRPQDGQLVHVFRGQLRQDLCARQDLAFQISTESFIPRSTAVVHLKYAVPQVLGRPGPLQGARKLCTQTPLVGTEASDTVRPPGEGKTHGKQRTRLCPVGLA